MGKWTSGNLENYKGGELESGKFENSKSRKVGIWKSVISKTCKIIEVENWKQRTIVKVQKWTSRTDR